jgi:hypothetical protein
MFAPEQSSSRALEHNAILNTSLAYVRGGKEESRQKETAAGNRPAAVVFAVRNAQFT